jgi:hypothetical protein
VSFSTVYRFPQAVRQRIDNGAFYLRGVLPFPHVFAPCTAQRAGTGGDA